MIIDKTVDGYIEFVESIVKVYQHRIKYFTVPAPVPQTINKSVGQNSEEDLNLLRIEVVKKFKFPFLTFEDRIYKKSIS